MELFNDFFDEIIGTLKGNMSDKAKQLINQRQLKNKLYNMVHELDIYLMENYENEKYYDSLYKYIHNGNVSQDTYSNDVTSAFYYTLICAFLCSDNNFLGETRFVEYHWTRILDRYPNYKYDKKNIEKFFLHCYNTFKEEFGCPPDTEKSLVNALKETSNENSDNLMKTIADESDSIKGTINDGIEKILKHGNAEGDTQPEKEDKICDQNNEYQERFEDTLFLESDINDGKIASLANIYIEPHFSFCFENLNQWAEHRDSRILLLYGKAGIGKTSFTAWLSLNNDFKRECHILELRQCISTLDSIRSWDSIKKCFNCMNDEEYQNKVLILDGLDEVCVFKSDFDGQEFIHNLSNFLRIGFGRSIRVIITSRMGYFSDIHRSNYIDVATIFWEEDSVEKWCEAYCKIHKNRTEWCESFKKEYADLDEDDKRKDVFCTPIILYICCVSQVDISKHDSVASIYDEAFNVIGKRQYNEWTQASQEEFEVNRQFTKELAFQMFLNDKLEDILSSDFVQIAKEKVVCWFKEKQSYHVNDLEFEKLFAINHFAYGKKDAIEFAHKTIGEYFTAVKLYEDYFEQIDGTIENTWQCIFNAFRYKAIPSDIMQYLVDLILNKKDDYWNERFFRAYYLGIKKQTLFATAYLRPEYPTSFVAIMRQLQMAFRNLTWLLTGLGFDNSQFDTTSENLQILVSFFYGDINVSGWKNLENLNLERAYLKGANFSSTILNGVDFRGAILESSEFFNADLKVSNFEGAHLKDAEFEGANLEGAHLKRVLLAEANLKGTHLEGAHLIGAHLKGAHFDGAHLEEADLEEAYLEGAYFTGANLKGACLISANLKRANFEDANLQGAHLNNAILNNAVLQRAHLEDAHLEEAHLKMASLNEAHLKKAHLQAANLEMAFLKGAHLEMVFLEGTHLEMAFLEGAHLEGAHLTRTYLEGAHFKGAHLEGAHLTRADLKEAELQGAYLDSESPVET